MLPISSSLRKLDLNPENSIVVGSGILNALGLRPSHDIDVIATPAKYQKLSSESRFQKQQSHNREILVDELLEIGTDWTVLGKTWTFEDLAENSIVIDNVRYITVEFLLGAKRGWIEEGAGRPKDFTDVELMEKYLSKLR
jgi:hypothetical protein